MKHDDIWRALDTLAAEKGFSASGLARRSGLDSTTFNPSKRRMPDGRARWPSTESLAKVFDATGCTLDAFAALVYGARALPGGSRAGAAAVRRIPLIGFAQAGGEGYFDDGGFPVGGSWDEVSSSYRRMRRCVVATAWWCAPAPARSWPSNSPGVQPGGLICEASIRRIRTTASRSMMSYGSIASYGRANEAGDGTRCQTWSE